MADCKTCVKSHRCDLCKAPRQQSSSICSSNWRCDIKEYCATGAVKKERCEDCKDHTPKCSTDGKLNLKLVDLITNFDFRLLCKTFIFYSVWFCGSKMWNWGVG